ncbi:hypothetical protein ACFFGT_26815 [Mucilaginibacter angelicae]|uniref:Uncharacterized protein n=1 Tax=Mucilaginibacter angelicae TaxID=869718 RepID=A0ABV6LEG1_9SPHI
MKSDLDQIIEYLESEKQSLELSIKRNLAEYDYLYAHYQQEGLWRLNNHLDTLKYFKDPLFNKKQDIERWIRWMSRLENNDLESLYKDDIAEKKQELEKLNKDQVYKYFNDSQVIDEALFDLYEGRISRFRLCLSKEDGFYLDFEMSNDFLKISYRPDPMFDSYEYIRDIDDDDDDEVHLHPLEKLGFSWDTDGKQLIFRYDMRGFKEALPVKVLLSRIAYEKFNFGLGHHDLTSSVDIFYK